MIQRLKIFLSVIFGIYLILGSVPRCDTFYDLNQILFSQTDQASDDGDIDCHDDLVGVKAKIDYRDDYWTRTSCQCEIMKSHLLWIQQDFSPQVKHATQTGTAVHGVAILIQQYSTDYLLDTPPPRQS